MVGAIYFINMPYSDFSNYKGRPVLVFQLIDNNDILILPLTTNLNRNGFVLANNDIQAGNLKKKSVLIIPKITAIDKSLIQENKRIAVIKDEVFEIIKTSICEKINCR